MKTVGEVAELAGVTVRLLHHYDEIGVLCPSARSDAGYRLYSFEDLERLQEILVWRQLGFPLAEIKALIDDRSYDRSSALRRQRELVESELGRLGAVARALDAALAAVVNGTRPKETTMFEGFDHSQYEAEARERWGDTEAYRESARRTASYGEPEWQAVKDESASINEAFVALLHAREPADGAAARAVAERHRQHISRWFYDCSPSLHRGLAEMYVTDPRFTEGYERQAPGLAAYVHDAIVANADAVAARPYGLRSVRPVV
jgi:DNA-binding transcriptional MerR regulator